MQPPQGWQRLNQGAPTAVLLTVVLLVLYRLLPVLELIAIALLLAVIFRTLLTGLQQIVKLRWLAFLLLVGLAFGFVVFLALAVIPNVIKEITVLADVLPDYVDKLSQNLQSVQDSFGLTLDISGGLRQLKSLLYESLSGFPTALNQIFGLTIEAIATLFLALYIARDPNFFIKGALRLTPRAQRTSVVRILRNSQAKIQGWLLGTGIAMLFLGVSATLGLWIIGIPLALSFGVVAGLFQFIPYFGSIAGTFLPALVALTISPTKLVWVLLLFFSLNQIDAYLLQPIVVGNRVDLHPAIVVISFLIMENLFGFVGILVAVPVAAISLAVFDEWCSR